ncbi:hypothetical protein BJ085DRAFT_35477 [Dimargaris cristalligena]|uniref:USP domain-containing protein n=1 Tax=Dimargaris cristalligena TaxID=215637 RepID=A0A4P9ZKL5_9FUNG|nr:hypothetical protein BJ085DRAFT_35477 [Dimargaris cristalligena]|eukprot:RKP33787.1 hypothetical protein BJ085DRAFT_35477 [Dimargaris cristalligena]
MLSLDLPPAPLFQDEVRENIIPQIPLAELLDKYNGSTAQLTATQAKYHRLQRLPPYLIITIQRFSRSNFSVDKNPTLVTFPLVNLDLADGVAESPRLGDHYDLLSNISHTGSGPRRGKDGSDREAPSSGSYQVDLKHLASDEWYRIQDLFVNPIDPQRLFLSGAYIQIWRRRPNL